MQHSVKTWTAFSTMQFFSLKNIFVLQEGTLSFVVTAVLVFQQSCSFKTKPFHSNSDIVNIYSIIFIHQYVYFIRPIISIHLLKYTEIDGCCNEGRFLSARSDAGPVLAACLMRTPPVPSTLGTLWKVDEHEKMPVNKQEMFKTYGKSHVFGMCFILQRIHSNYRYVHEKPSCLHMNFPRKFHGFPYQIVPAVIFFSIKLQIHPTSSLICIIYIFRLPLDPTLNPRLKNIYLGNPKCVKFKPFQTKLPFTLQGQ